jgi:hypothetical protein
VCDWRRWAIEHAPWLLESLLWNDQVLQVSLEHWSAAVQGAVRELTDYSLLNCRRVTGRCVDRSAESWILSNLWSNVKFFIRILRRCLGPFEMADGHGADKGQWVLSRVTGLPICPFIEGRDMTNWTNRRDKSWQIVTNVFNLWQTAMNADAEERGQTC